MDYLGTKLSLLAFFNAFLILHKKLAECANYLYPINKQLQPEINQYHINIYEIKNNHLLHSGGQILNKEFPEVVESLQLFCLQQKKIK